MVQGNYIGTDVTGTLSLGNINNGVLLETGSSGNTIGGTATGAGNLISGNGDFGIAIGTSSNVIQGNFIGTDASGKQPLPNLPARSVEHTSEHQSLRHLVWPLLL